MKATAYTGLALVLVAGLLSGCGAVNKLGGEGGGWSSEDQAGVSNAMATDQEVVEDGVFDDEGTTAAGALAAGPESGESTAELIRPLRFWRHIARTERRFEFAFSDTDSTGRPTTAVVSIHKQMVGTFNILVGDSMTAGTDSASLNIIHKPLADEWVRRVLVRRVARRGDDSLMHREWKVVASSLVNVTSNVPDISPTRIDSIRIQSGDQSITITDPTALVWREHLPRFMPGAQVVLTVTTERPDDVVALIHKDRRFFLHPNGDNTYTAMWTAPVELGVRHLGINALARGTVFDDRAGYSSQAWLWPYGVSSSPTAAN